jgi:hypothetical protein
MFVSVEELVRLMLNFGEEQTQRLLLNFGEEQTPRLMMNFGEEQTPRLMMNFGGPLLMELIWVIVDFIFIIMVTINLK